MVCHLLGTKPLPKPILTHGQLETMEHISIQFYLKFESLIQENAFENALLQIANEQCSA